MTRQEEILIRLGINSAAVTKGLGIVQGQINEFARTIKGTLSTAIGGYLTEEGIRSIIEYGKEIDNTAKRLGVSTEAVQVWSYALRKTGQDQQAMISFFEKMATARDKALGGENGMLTAFKEFGISIDDLKSKRLEDLAEQISDVFKAGDPQKLVGSLREIGGRAAGGAIDALKDGIKDAKKEAEDLGLVMSDHVIGKLKQAGDELTTIGIKLKTFFADPLVAVMEHIQVIWELIKGGIKETILGAHILTTEIKQFGPLTPAQKAFYQKEYEAIGDQGERNVEAIFKRRRQAKFTGGGTEIDNEEKLRLAEERHKLEHQAEMESLSIEGKINELWKERNELIDRLNDKSVVGIDHERVKNDLVKNGLDIATQEKALKEASIELDKQKEQLSFAQKRRDEAANIYPTIDNLAKSGFAFKSSFGNQQWHWQQGPFAQIAQEIERLKGDELGARTFGNIDRATWDKNRRLELSGRLEAAGIISPEKSLESIDEEIKRLNKSIAEGTGKIQVPMNR